MEGISDNEDWDKRAELVVDNDQRGRESLKEYHTLYIHSSPIFSAGYPPLVTLSPFNTPFR